MTEQNKHPEESGLDLFRPTAEDERKGITGITMEQEIVSVATLRARKRAATPFCWAQFPCLSWLWSLFLVP